MKTQQIIYWSKPHILGKESIKVKKAIDTTWISGGKYIQIFENKLSKYLKKKYSFLVSNGTAALHLAFLALDLKKNDEIIIPGFGYMAAANLAKLMNLKIKFSDIDKETFVTNLESLKKKISKKTKAVVFINTYGNMTDIDKIQKFCNQKKIYLIEDAAESFGCIYKKKISGSYGDVSTFSFHATKNITTGEGGLVVTNNKKIAKKLNLYRSHGVDKERYNHLVPGHNFRLTNLQAALGLEQFKNKKIFFENRKHAYQYYKKNLNENSFKLQRIGDLDGFIPWSLPLIFSDDKKKLLRKIINNLKNNKIEFRRAFFSADRLKYFNIKKNQIPNSSYVSKNLISLPLFSGIRKKEIKKITNALKVN